MFGKTDPALCTLMPDPRQMPWEQCVDYYRSERRATLRLLRNVYQLSDATHHEVTGFTPDPNEPERSFVHHVLSERTGKLIELIRFCRINADIMRNWLAMLRIWWFMAQHANGRVDDTYYQMRWVKEENPDDYQSIIKVMLDRKGLH